MTFERMWRDLLPVGRSAATGGYRRLPYTAADAECRAWFLAECAGRGLEVTGDRVGNLVAWWPPRADSTGSPTGPPAGSPTADATTGATTPGIVTGSHLDSVVDGGAYDGPLGVVSALAAFDLLRDRGFAPARPVGVAVFVAEEGSRFGVACLGSRLLTGRLPWQAAAGLRDADGVGLAAAVEGAGVPEPGVTLVDREVLLAGVGCFVELHVEQGRDLVDRDAPVGAASGIWPHGRYRFAFTGEANHAGTTRLEDRRDPMLTYAMTVLAANKQARLAGARATFGRVDVRPNATNAVPSAVTAWLDARAESPDRLDALLTDIGRLADDRAGRDGTSVEVVAESVSPPVAFDPALTAGPWPLIPTAAGHDAGVLQAAGIPSGMLFVRNPSGVSHAPGEHAEAVDCLAGVEALADTLRVLAGPSASSGSRA